MISFIQEVTWFPASILLRQVESKPAALRKQGHKSAEIFKRVQNTIERWWGHQWLTDFDSCSHIPQVRLKYFPFVDQISSGHMFNLKFPWSCQLVVSHDNSLFSHKFKETICSFNTTSVPRDHPLSQTMAFLWFLLYTPSASVPLPSSWCK